MVANVVDKNIIELSQHLARSLYDHCHTDEDSMFHTTIITITRIILFEKGEIRIWL